MLKITVRLEEVKQKVDGMKVVARIHPLWDVYGGNGTLKETKMGWGIGIWRTGNTINNLPCTSNLYHFVGELVLPTRCIRGIIPPIGDDWGYLLDNDLVNKEVCATKGRVGKEFYFKIARIINDDNSST